MAKFLFVCGVARSGTTATAKLLNLHPDIVMGIERFKYVLMRQQAPETDFQSLFSKERFFDYRESDTNVRLDAEDVEQYYTRAEKKFDTAVYVGDKIPGLYKRTPWLKRQFPTAKILYLIRPPLEVACSWQGRADKGGSWPNTNGYEASVHEWNSSIEKAIELKKRYPDHFLALHYGDVFGPGGVGAFGRVLEWLGLSPDATGECQDFIEASAASVAKAKNRVVPDEIVGFVAKTARYRLLEGFDPPLNDLLGHQSNTE